MNTPLIIRKFQITRDYRSVRWRATLVFNLERSIAAGLMFAIIFSVVPVHQGPPTPPWVWPLLWPVSYLILLLPLAIVTNVIAQLFPVAYLFSAFLALISVALGDPLICLLKFVFPRIIPVDEPPCFSLAPALWVLDTPTEYAISSDSLSG